MRGTSAWQCGHQCATMMTRWAFPVLPIVTGDPLNVTPVSVGAVLPTAGSLLEPVNIGSGVPLTATVDAISTWPDFVPPLELPLLPPPPELSTTARTPAITTAPPTAHQGQFGPADAAARRFAPPR